MHNLQLFHHQLLQWYDANHRILPWRDTQNPYIIWVSEIILQQTRVAQGFDYFMRFVERFPTVADLAAAEEDEVLRYWQGLGYYSRARNMHAAAQQIMQDFNGVFPVAFEDVKSLRGVGDYTAAAICSFAYGAQYAVLDGNVYRVLARLFDNETVFDTPAGKRLFHSLAEDILNRDNPAAHNQAMMEFGALYCVPTSPDCAACPLQVHCEAYRHNTVELLPVRKEKQPLKDRYLHFFIYRTYDDFTLIHRREGNDIWKHLYEFPLVETPTEQEVSCDYCPVSSIQHPISTFTHVLSHQRLHARFYYIRCEELPTIPDTLRVHWSELDDYAFPQLIIKALSHLQ